MLPIEFNPHKFSFVRYVFVEIFEVFLKNDENGQDESKLSFLRTSQRFYSALVILEPQIYVVVEQFGAENIPLLSGRLVNRKVGLLDVNH